LQHESATGSVSRTEVTYRIGDIPSLLHPVCYSYPQGNILYCDSSRAKSERRSGRGMYENEERTLGKMEERKERRKREK